MPNQFGNSLRAMWSDRAIPALVGDCHGQDLVEYALLIAVVALGSLAAITALQTAITAVWTAISANLST